MGNKKIDEGIKFNYQYNGKLGNLENTTSGSEGAKDKWNHIAITREWKY